ncbi:hypothetical protein Tco_1474880 [Tanacetum coccineum]
MATLIFSSNILPASGGRVLGPEIIAHSIGMIMLLRNVTVPPSTGNLIIPLECPSSPIFTSKDTIWLLISGRSLTKQCSYKISEDAPPSTYIRCTKCPPISASMIIGPSVPSSSPRGGKDVGKIDCNRLNTGSITVKSGSNS